MNDYFEEIKIYLVSKSLRSRKVLHKTLKNMGYISEDDFYYFNRCDSVMPWQAEELLTLDIRLGDESKYETEKDIEDGVSTDWNTIVVSYLLATLPEENISLLIEKINELMITLNLSLFFDGAETNLILFSEKLAEIAKKLAESYAPTGSEELALLIEENYG